VSLGYSAEAFGITLAGARVPHSLTDQAEVSAADLSALKEAIQSGKVSEALGKEVGSR